MPGPMCDIFQGQTAWFSSSVDPERVALWSKRKHLVHFKNLIETQFNI